MPPALIVDPKILDFDHPLVDLDAIRKVNPQRYEMEQLTGIVRLDPKEQIIVGYKEVGREEFWVRGHMPGFPLMPGVLICEAAAQLCSFYITTQGLASGDFVAFGGMENVKFRGAVRPGDRLIIVARLVEVRPGRRAIFNCQGIVDGSLVFHGDVIGVPFSQPSSSRGSTETA
jgi:3-hydroxyacyl-[acyl-carrier-protein] dehydratase